MRNILKFMAVLLCLTVFLAVTPNKAAAADFQTVSATENKEDMEALKEYVEENTLPFIKGWLKSSGKVGKYFESTEEIENLQVGDIFRVYGLQAKGDFDKVSNLSEMLLETDQWMVLFCSPDGDAKWFATVMAKEDGMGYKFAQEGCAIGLGQALEVFMDINSKQNVSVTPTVIYYRPHEMIVMEVIDGREYVITAGKELDSSYIGITEAQYLPTGKDAVKALREVVERNKAESEDGLVYGDMGLFWLTAFEQPKSKPVLETWHILLVAGGACVIAVAVCLIVGTKRKAKR